MNRVSEIYVILPTYNNEKTIERAIFSVLNQSYKGEMTLLVVPNGCTDKTVELANKIQYQVSKEKLEIKSRCNIKCLDSNHLKGVVSAFNFGMVYAMGIQLTNMDIVDYEKTWICRMDGDDAWHSDKIEKQVEYLNANETVDVLSAQMNYVTPNEYKHIGITSNPLTFEEIVTAMSRGSNVIANPAAIFKLSVINKAGILEDIFPYAEDYWFWLKVLLTKHTFANMPDILMDYTYEHKPHENPNVGQTVAQIANYILQYNDHFKKKW